MAILASLSLAAVLASGSTTVVVGCGSNSGSSSGSSSGGQDSGPGDSSPKTDSGPADSNTPDTNMVVDTGVADTHVEPQLAAPSFTPPGPAAILMGSTVTINPPAGLPTGGQLLWLATGAVPTPGNGNLYVGPIQVNAAETIIAIAHDPANNFSDSPPASAAYTIQQPEAGSLGNVGFNPGSITENNDFLVQLSGSASATICYTLDGTTPTCAAGVCTGASKTYDAGSGGVSVNGTDTAVSNPPTGKLVLTALQCETGDTNGPSIAQNYQLIVADPTMVLGGKNVPVGTGMLNLPWPGGTAGIAPTITTATNNSIIVNDPASIWYTTGAGVIPPAPTCSTGTPIVTPPGLQAPVLTFSLNTNTTISALGCKQGYSQSNVATFPFTIQENQPVLAAGGATNTYPYAFSLSETAAPNGLTPLTTPAGTPGIVDTLNAGTATAGAQGPGGSKDWVCLTNNNGDPTCGTTVFTCGTPATMTAVWAGHISSLPVPGAANTTPNTTVKAIACGLGVNPSAEVTTTYTLQQAPPWLLTTNGLTPTLPGWAFKTTGAPATGMTVPNGAGATYGPFFAYQVGDTAGVGPCATEVSAAGSSNNYGCLTLAATLVPTTTPQLPDYLCYVKNATAACGTVNTSATAGAASCSIGTAQNPGGGALFNNADNTGTGALASNQAPGGVDLSAITVLRAGGDKISVIACSVGTGGVGAPTMLASAPTTVTFSAAGAATQPNIPTPANPYSQQAIVTVTNADVTAGGSTICFTVDGTTPSCGATPSTQNICQHGFCGVGGGTFDETANCSDLVAPTGANSTFTIPAADDTGLNNPGATPVGGLLQKDGQVLQAIACNTAETPSPASSATYHFTAAQPSFTDQAGIGPGTVGDLNNGGTVGAGTCVNLSSLSNFDFPGGTNGPMTIAYAWNGPASCGSANTITAGSGFAHSVAFATPPPPVTLASEPVANWPTGTIFGLIPAPTKCALVPSTGATAVLNAVTCGNTTATQVTSAPRSATFNVTTAQPVVWTDQDLGQFGGCLGQGGIDPLCLQLHTPWQNPFGAVIFDPTPGATLCYSTNGGPVACNAGGGGCASGTPVTPGAGNQPISAAIAFDGVANGSGTQLQAVACLPGTPQPIPNSPPLNVSPVLQLTPLTETPPGGTLPCSTAANPTNVSVQQTGSCFGGSQPAADLMCPNGQTCVNRSGNAATSGACSGSTTFLQGGPTGAPVTAASAPFSALAAVSEIDCYTTDQSLPNVTATCTAGNASTTCVTQNNQGAVAAQPALVTQTGNLNTLTCAFHPGQAVSGFAGTAAGPAYTVPAYVGHITVDGVMTDWVLAASPYGESIATDNGATGYFSYDATRAYFGYKDNGQATNPANLAPAVAIYIGNDAAGGATKATPSGADTWSTDTAPQGADKAGGFTRAFEWVYGAATIASSYTWNLAGLKWVADTTALNVTVGNIAGNGNAEFSVLLTDIGSPGLITSAGAIYVSYGDTNNNKTLDTWASNGSAAHYSAYFRDLRASCTFPNASFGPP